MTAVFGRCDTGSDPMSLSTSGSQRQISGWLIAADVNGLHAYMQQMNGLADNPDEPVIPCTFSHDSSFDGFYRVVSTTVTPVVEYTTRARYSIALEQVPGFANPVFEQITRAVERTNPHGITGGNRFAIVFQSTQSTAGNEYDVEEQGSLSGGNSSYSRTVQDSATAMFVHTLTEGTFGPISLMYATPPAQYYYGAARIEIQFGGTWYPVVGRNIPRVTQPWRLSNGFVRLTSANGGTSGTFEVWNGSAWESANVTHINRTIGDNLFGIGMLDSTLTDPTSVSILRNSPEHVTVKVFSSSRSMVYGLQRGQAFATADFHGATAVKVGCGYTSATAATAITGGIRATSNDGNGNRLVFSQPVSFTTDLVNGRLWPATAATNCSMAIGVEFNGSSSATPNQATQVVSEYLFMPRITQRVVVR